MNIYSLCPSTTPSKTLLNTGCAIYKEIAKIASDAKCEITNRDIGHVMWVFEWQKYGIVDVLNPHAPPRPKTRKF